MSYQLLHLGVGYSVILLNNCGFIQFYYAREVVILLTLKF